MTNIIIKTGLVSIIAAAIFSCDNPRSMNFKYIPKNEAGFESRIRDAIEKEIGCTGVAIEYNHIDNVKKILSEEKRKQYIDGILQKLSDKAMNDIKKRCNKSHDETYEGVAFPLVSGNLIFYMKNNGNVQERVENAIKMIGEKKENIFEYQINY